MNANKPAYPTSYEANAKDQTGLSKRELVAAMAMQGCLASPDIDNTPQWTPELMARIACDCADALLAELERTKK